MRKLIIILAVLITGCTAEQSKNEKPKGFNLKGVELGAHNQKDNITTLGGIVGRIYAIDDRHGKSYGLNFYSGKIPTDAVEEFLINVESKFSVAFDDTEISYKKGYKTEYKTELDSLGMIWIIGSWGGIDEDDSCNLYMSIYIDSLKEKHATYIKIVRDSLQTMVNEERTKVSYKMKKERGEKTIFSDDFYILHYSKKR